MSKKPLFNEPQAHPECKVVGHEFSLVHPQNGCGNSGKKYVYKSPFPVINDAERDADSQACELPDCGTPLTVIRRVAPIIEYPQT